MFNKVHIKPFLDVCGRIDYVCITLWGPNVLHNMIKTNYVDLGAIFPVPEG